MRDVAPCLAVVLVFLCAGVGVVETLRGAGLSVTTGTVNHGALLPRLLGLGVDAITSDVPHQLRAELARADALRTPADTVAGNRAAAM